MNSSPVRPSSPSRARVAPETSSASPEPVSVNGQERNAAAITAAERYQVYILLNAHAGTRYGIPFPVMARASFGLTTRAFLRTSMASDFS